MSLCLFLRSFSAIWVLLHHLTWQCNNKRQGRTESLDWSSKLLRISSKFHVKKQNTLTFYATKSTKWCLKITFLQSVPVNLASGSHNSIEKINYSSKISAIYPWLQSSSKVLGRLPFLPLLFLPPPAPGPMLIKTLMFVRVIVLLYPNIEQGGRGIFSKRENSLFSGLKWTTVKLYSLPNYFCLWL